LTDDRAEARWPWLPLALGIAVLVVLGGYGAVRLVRTPTQLVDKVHLRIMQPNLQQDVRFNYAAKKEVMNRYVTLSDRSTGPDASGMKGVTHLIWPESPFPFLLTHEADALEQITQLLPEGAVLITGAIRLAEPVEPGNPRAYNSIYVIDHTGSIVALYDKVHLVPFGEYLPFEHLLERLGFQELTKQRGGFLAGDRRRLMTVPDAPPALPLICYEAIFPGDIVPPGQRPGWLVNVTNDGWFGISTGPYQHLQQARMRTIEEGLPLVRAANTGISAVIDPVGRVIAALPLGHGGVLDAALPQSIPAPLYARIGDLPASILVALAVIVVMRGRFRGDVRKSKLR
jgi:apolipoprotein N-acyltransferase